MSDMPFGPMADYTDKAVAAKNHFIPRFFFPHRQYHQCAGPLCFKDPFSRSLSAATQPVVKQNIQINGHIKSGEDVHR